MQSQNTKKTVFVANISFEVGLEQLKELFSRVGTVTKVRIVTDKETGRSRGFGFIEFAEESSVTAAVSQLHGLEINGRPIRVDRSEGGRQNTANPVEAALNSLSLAQVHDVVAQMKDFVAKKPDQAREVLLAHPQLAQALLQAQIMLGMLRTGPGGMSQPQPQQQQQHQQQQGGFMAPGPGGVGMGMGGQMGGGGHPGPGGMGRGMGGGGPPVANLNQMQTQLLNQVRQMTPAQVESLPPDQQQQVRALRMSMGMQ